MDGKERRTELTKAGTEGERENGRSRALILLLSFLRASTSRHTRLPARAHRSFLRPSVSPFTKVRGEGGRTPPDVDATRRDISVLLLVVDG